VGLSEREAVGEIEVRRPGGFQYPGSFGNQIAVPRDVLENLRAEDVIEGVRLEREFTSITDDEGHLAVRIEFLIRDIDADDRPSDPIHSTTVFGPEVQHTFIRGYTVFQICVGR